MEQMLEKYKQSLHRRNLEQRTIHRYALIVKSMLSEISHISTDALTKYKTKLANSVSVITYNHKAVILNQFLKEIDCDFKFKVVKVQRKTSLDNVPTEYHITRMKNKLKSVGDIQLEAIFLTLLYTGVRLSEVQYFTVKSLKDEKVEIFTKNKQRVIILPDILIRHLKYYAKQAGITKGVLFRGSATNPNNWDWVRTKLKKYALEAKIKSGLIFPHNIRHFYSKHFMKKHGKIWILKDLLGHSSLNSTAIYLQESLKEQKDFINQLY